MNSTTNQEQVQTKLLERLQLYQDTMTENKDLLDQLMVRLSAGTTTIDMALLSRLDDIMEDINTLNFDTKNVLNCLDTTTLSLSPREPARNVFYRQIKTFLPLLFFWHHFETLSN